MNAKTIATLAAGLAAGVITEDYITEHFGDSMLTKVLAFGAGGAVAGIAGSVAGSVLNEVDRHTGLVSFADDVVSSLNPFKW